MSEARFTVEVGADAPIAFAQLSGDWNPLHTNGEYAAKTPFGRPVLHGAFLTGLLSRLAGMYLPGEKCLLHGISIRFIAPVQPPASLSVVGRLSEGTMNQGRVAVRIVDATSGATYAEGHYDFGLHTTNDAAVAPVAHVEDAGIVAESIVVTGASGGLAKALLEKLPDTAIGFSRSRGGAQAIRPTSVQDFEGSLGNRRISAIVHCAWPFPDNESLTELTDVGAATEYNLAAPVREIIELAHLLKRRGTPDSVLVLIGSTFADPGRHNYRMPFYTLAKSLIPPLTRILATEFAGSKRRCLGVVFDVIEGGMNKRLSPTTRAGHKDRSPFGRIATLEDAAGQLQWVLDNRSFLVSGSVLDLRGAAIP